MSELECYLNALKNIYVLTWKPYHSRESRLAHAEAKKALLAWGRIAPSEDSKEDAK